MLLIVYHALFIYLGDDAEASPQGIFFRGASPNTRSWPLCPTCWIRVLHELHPAINTRIGCDPPRGRQGLVGRRDVWFDPVPGRPRHAADHRSRAVQTEDGPRKLHFCAILQSE